MKRNTFILWAGILAVGFALAGLAYLGTFTRFMADDFCVAGQALNLGMLDMLSRWYTTVNGRFSAIIISTLLVSGGPGLAGWMPAMTVIAWWAGIAWATLPILRCKGLQKPCLFATLLGGISLLALLASTPNLYQSFFWHSGMVTYSLPLVGLTFSAGIILRVWLEDTQLLPSAAALFILTFLLGGVSEMISAIQVVLFLLLLVLSLLHNQKKTRQRLLSLLIPAMLAAVISITLVILSPGSRVRLETVGTAANQPGLLRIITFSIRNMAHIVGKYFIWTPYWALFSLLPPFLLGWLFSKPLEDVSRVKDFRSILRQDWPKGIVLVLGSALVLVTAACAPVVYGLNAYPDDRAIIIPQFVLVLAAVSASMMLGWGLKSSAILPVPSKKKGLTLAIQLTILLLVLTAAGLSLWGTAAQAPAYRSFAISWDERSALIQQAAQAGDSEITVPGGSSMFGVGNLNAKADNWINACMATYYQIPLIFGR